MRLLQPLLLLLALLFPHAQAVAGRAEIADPPPVAIPAGLSQEQVMKDIRRALIGRGWTVKAERPGEMDAELHLRNHIAFIKLAYDASDVRLSFVDSRNLDYKEKNGKRYIHSNYLGWVGYLVQDLNTNFRITAAGG